MANIALANTSWEPGPWVIFWLTVELLVSQFVSLFWNFPQLWNENLKSKQNYLLKPLETFRLNVHYIWLLIITFKSPGLTSFIYLLCENITSTSSEGSLPYSPIHLIPQKTDLLHTAMPHTGMWGLWKSAVIPHTSWHKGPALSISVTEEPDNVSFVFYHQVDTWTLENKLSYIDHQKHSCSSLSLRISFSCKGGENNHVYNRTYQMILIKKKSIWTKMKYSYTNIFFCLIKAI